MTMQSDECPVCGGSEGEDCHYNELRCPTCGKVVSWYREGHNMNECKHVVAWGVIGDREPVWENRRQEALFCRFEKNVLGASGEDGEDHEASGGADTEELLEAFAKKAGMSFATHDDGGPHGHAQGFYFVFAPAKKPPVRQKHRSGRRRRTTSRTSGGKGRRATKTPRQAGASLRFRKPG
jgi:hypothetical protein